VLDFTSALYLGLRHPSSALDPWSQLTTGVPAGLAEPRVAGSVAGLVAKLQGCEAGVVGTSTLHLAWDLMGLLARDSITVHVDASTYPVLRWGAAWAGCHGMPVHTFPAHDAHALGRSLERTAGRGRRPVVVTDGFCTACGRAAPLRDYVERVRAAGGLLVIDDTQALGVLGRRESTDAPYGLGGGGSLPWNAIADPEVIVIASLAKAFGAPVATLTGAAAIVRRFAGASETRVHCSPPSVAALHAAHRALTLNDHRGDSLRATLLSRVQRFRRGLAASGLRTRGGTFPVQSLKAPRGCAATELHARLADLGVRAVLTREASRGGATVTLLITARHSTGEIDRAAASIAASLGSAPSTLSVSEDPCRRTVHVPACHASAAARSRT
jgi:8-amino-7-oxononanoate synthase